MLCLLHLWKCFCLWRKVKFPAFRAFVESFLLLPVLHSITRHTTWKLEPLTALASQHTHTHTHKLHVFPCNIHQSILLPMFRNRFAYWAKINTKYPFSSDQLLILLNQLHVSIVRTQYFVCKTCNAVLDKIYCQVTRYKNIAHRLWHSTHPPTHTHANQAAEHCHKSNVCVFQWLEFPVHTCMCVCVGAGGGGVESEWLSLCLCVCLCVSACMCVCVCVCVHTCAQCERRDSRS